MNGREYPPTEGGGIIRLPMRIEHSPVDRKRHKLRAGLSKPEEYVQPLFRSSRQNAPMNLTNFRSALRHPIRPVVILGVIGASLALAACGSSSATNATTTTTPTGSGSSAGTTAFTTCLAKHGVKLPSGAGFNSPPSGTSGGAPPAGASGPPAGASGFASNPKFQTALQACAKYQTGGVGGFKRPSSTAFAAYRNCMKLHGVTLAAGSPGTTQSTLNASSATYKAAASACKSLLPVGGAPSTPGTAG